MKKPISYGATLALMSSFANVHAANSDADYQEQVKDQGTIIIKGQKIERSKHETVESVMVYDAQDLEDSNLDDFYDLANQTANFTRNGNFEFSIRGISSVGPAGGSTQARTISVVADGATMTNRATQAGVLSTWDMEQVEVLRGPQSTNQGRNALAGAVILKSKAPEFVANGQARASLSEYGTYQLAIAQTGAITENLAFRFALDHQETDGYIDNVILQDEDWNASETNTLRGKLLYKAENGSEWLFTATDVNYEESGDDNILFNAFQREAFDNYESIRKTTANNYILEGSIPLSSGFTLTTISSVSDSNFFRDSDSDSFQKLDGNGVIGQDLDERILSQDLRVNFESDTLNLVTGFYFAKGKVDSLVESIGFDFTSVFAGLVGSPLPPESALLDTSGKSVEEFENYAAYFNADYKVTNKLTLISGLRIDYEERSSNNFNEIVHSVYGSGYGGLLGNPFQGEFNGLGGASWGQALARFNGSGQDKDDFLVFLPKLGVKYDLTQDMNIAATFQTGYRSGGVSTNLSRGTAKSFDEEITKNYELSFRSKWLDDRLVLNANLFYVDWQDMQVDVQLSRGNPYDEETRNAGEAHLWGGELESVFEVTDEVTLNASVGYVQTEFDKFETNPEYEGNEFAGAPDVTGNVGATYRNQHGYMVTGNVSHVGEAYTNANNKITRDAYTLVNAKVGYESEYWAAYVFADNLLDKDYRLNEFETQLPNDARAYETGAPRTLGVAANIYW